MEVNLCSFFIVYLYIRCRWRTNYHYGVGSPLTGLTTSYSMPVECHDMDIERHISRSLCSMVWGRVVVVCFIDIGEIADHRC